MTSKGKLRTRIHEVQAQTQVEVLRGSRELATLFLNHRADGAFCLHVRFAPKVWAFGLGEFFDRDEAIDAGLARVRAHYNLNGKAAR